MRKKQEETFANVLLKKLKKKLKNYQVSKGDALIYKVIVDNEGQFKPNDSANPRRGTLAFQTDILIKKNKLPLVVIETKFEGFSTHDVLTYSAKALKHKEIYPYLRYGLVVGGVNLIHNKFFTHNLGFDFALAIESTNNLDTFFSVIKKQIRSSELLLDILKTPHRTKTYVSHLKVEKI